jgi:DNA-binding XRE family transcriptional regulator
MSEINYFQGNLKYLRAVKSMTQSELGNEFGLKKSQISLYENGGSYPLIPLARKIALYFGLTLNDLFEKDLIPNSPSPPNDNGKHAEGVGESNPLKAVREEKEEAEQPPPLPQNKGDNNKEEIKLLRQTALDILNKIELMNA